MTPSRASHPLHAGPLGYNGSKAGMELIAKADVVLALGTRLNPFSTLPGYGIDYWPKNAKIIQVDINPDRIGLTKPVTVGIVGDAAKVAESFLERLGPAAGDTGRAERKATMIAPDEIRLGAGADLDGPRGRRSRHHLERARPRAKPDWMSPAHGLAGDSERRCRRRRSSPPTSATTAPSATPIRPSRKAANTWPPACSVPCGYGLPDRRRQDRPARTCRSSALPATAPSASR